MEISYNRLFKLLIDKGISVIDMDEFMMRFSHFITK